MNSPTRKLKVKKFICMLISIALNLIPMLMFIVIGYCKSGTVQKVKLTASIVVAIMLLIVNIVTKLRLRSLFWILLCGIGACLNDLHILFYTMTITILIDEFIFTPLYRHYKERYTINKEIDRRG